MTRASLEPKKQPRRQGQIFFIFKNWAKLKSYILQEFNCKVICLKVHRYYSILLLARNKSRKCKELKNESEIKPQLYIRLDSQKHRNMKVKRFRIEVIWNSLNPAFFFQISGCYKQVFLSFDLLRFSTNESSPKEMHYLCNSISNHLTIQCSLVYILYKLFIYTDQF